MWTQSFANISMDDIAAVGGKNASIGELYQHLTSAGVKVPPGFALTAQAYQYYLKENKIEKELHRLLQAIDPDNMQSLRHLSSEIRTLIMQGEIPQEVSQEIEQAYLALDLRADQSVAVRSSATLEDLPTASFAGQQDTYLNVSGIDKMLVAIKKVYASLFTARAISYRMHRDYAHHDVAISVGIQLMVRSDLAASGVMFTVDTESGFEDVIFITSAYGLGELMVQGEVNPDEFYVFKPTLMQNCPAIIRRKCGPKKRKMIYEEANDQSVKTIATSEEERQSFSLNDQEILTLAEQACAIEEHYGRPMDIEWAKDGVTQEIYIVQARPETVTSNHDANVIERYQLTEKGKLLISGSSVGNRIGQGEIAFLKNSYEIDRFKDGQILLTDMTDPDWEPIMAKAKGIITNRGGRTCHAAIVARELGIPAVVGCGNATEVIPNGCDVTVSCAEGEKGYIYEGKLNFEIETTKVEQLPPLPFKLCINLANPDLALSYHNLPNAGVGLARLEFVISNHIGMHPKLLLDYDELQPDLQQQVRTLTGAYSSPKEFYIEKLTEGIATIAAAVYPKNIIVRFSDFKSNEYAGLLGGDRYEPIEENPMLGYRGASRYLTGMYQPCFLLECEAIRRVRNKLGLKNTQVMFPFVRTLEEARQLNELMSSEGLARGEDGLEIYMMCEIPANAVLAEEFLEYFDGFSIGSNDLTQLTLGLDRDSSLVAHLFEERNAAVLSLLSHVIKICKSKNKYVGICGQGPSDHLDFAQWLAEQNIDAISLVPDTIINTWIALSGHRNY